ncbi:hypothetical protein D0T53_13285 [Dysgonomonas sp. 216]|uniref:hypothetical protein n=1 Tax=Dysgonomonas sp. 216 TaxID=2302934 RepID=UPI0013D17FDD|nr:hypothetical protein [Dysgonomonas sp. 216]NDW19872.1 hypothetical protein [Dysgonomonas sp. 216]
MENFRRYFLIYKDAETEIKEPIGFDGFKPKLSRGESHGTIWEYSEVTLGFCGAGYEICKTAYLNEGIETEVILLVEELFNNVWEEFYKGRLDFAQYTETKGNSYTIHLGIAQIDIQTVIRNRLETKVELESLTGFDGAALPEYESMKKEIYIEGKAVVTSSRLDSEKSKPANLSGAGLRYMSITFWNPVKEEFIELDNSLHTGNLSDIRPILTVPNNDIAYSNFRIKASFFVSAGGIGAPINSIKVFYKINEGDPVEISEDVPYFGASVSFDLNFNLVADDKFYLYALIDSGATGNWDANVSPIHNTEVAFFEVSGQSKYKDTPANLSLVHESLSRVVESITNGDVTVQSDYYARIDSEVNPIDTDGCGSLRGVVSGLNLRNGELTDGSLPSTYISLKDFLDSLSSIDCIGYGLQGNKLIVEPYRYFYKQDVIMSCNNVSNIERKIDLSRSYQLFNNGYKKWEAEEYNGIDGFHGKRQYRTSLKMSDTKLEKECSFVADGYAIEATRRKQIDNDTKDWRYDNDIFIICLKRNDTSIVVDTGVSDPDKTVIDSNSIYNASISPARNAMRWYSWIMQGVKLDDELIFAGGEGYVKAKLETSNECTIESSVLSESQNITLSQFKDLNYPYSIFKPEIISFNYPITRHDFTNIKSNPYGLIEFNGELGWIKEVEFDILKCMAKFQLIPKK